MSTSLSVKGLGVNDSHTMFPLAESGLWPNQPVKVGSPIMFNCALAGVAGYMVNDKELRISNFLRMLWLDRLDGTESMLRMSV